MRKLTPKNGRFLVALLAGGPADVGREVRQRLADRMGVLVAEHREYHRRGFGAAVPDRVDLVIVLKDMMGHQDHDAVMKAAKAAQVPVVRTQRKWATMSQALRAAGVGTSGPLPEEVLARNKLPQLTLEEAAKPENWTTPAAESGPPPEAPTLVVALLEVDPDRRRKVNALLLEAQALLPPGVVVLAEISRHAIEITWHT